MWHHGFGNGATYFGWNPVVVILAGFGLLVLYLIFSKSTTTRKCCSHGTDKSVDILKCRYAKGEITQEAFYKLKNELEELD